MAGAGQVLLLSLNPNLSRDVVRSMTPRLIKKFGPEAQFAISCIWGERESEATMSVENADAIIMNPLGFALVSLYFGNVSATILDTLNRGQYTLHTRCSESCGKVVRRCSSCLEAKWPWQLERHYVVHPDFRRYWETCTCGELYRYACKPCNEACRRLGGSIGDCKK